MKCPVDQATLVIADRNGVEIDYCPTCRGVWLDRGELDKIIDRADAAAPSRPSSYRADAPSRDFERADRDRSRDNRPTDRKKRESFLGELFDF